MITKILLVCILVTAIVVVCKCIDCVNEKNNEDDKA